MLSNKLKQAFEALFKRILKVLLYEKSYIKIQDYSEDES